MDVTAQRTMTASPRAVAKFMFDPSYDPQWIGGAKSVGDLPVDATAIGARVIRHGGFMGRKFSWQTEVVAFEPNALLDMRFIAGPMNGGGVTYRISPAGEGSLVSIQNWGPGPQFMGWFVRRSVSKDLDRLAALIEA